LGTEIADNLWDGDSTSNCLLVNMPTEPTGTQTGLVQDMQYNWLTAAVLVPFGLLILIGGWGATFRKGAASIFIVGVAITCIAESAFQQLGPNPEPLEIIRRYFLKRPPSSSDGIRIDSSVTTMAFLSIVIITWNMYFAIHDTQIAHPTVDYVQIVAFFGSLCLLPTVRFSGTEYRDPSDADVLQWTQFLLERVRGLHAKADNILVKVGSIPADRTEKRANMLENAVQLFHKVDDPWCEARAATILADTWDSAARPKEAQRARRAAISALDRYRSRH
jgi:hypothetical protein